MRTTVVSVPSSSRFVLPSHVTQRVYRLVPQLDFSVPWDDQALYARYQIADEEIALIDMLVKPVAWED